MNWCFSVHCTEEARPGLSRKPQLHKGAARCCTQVHPQPGEYSRGQDPGWFYQYVQMLWNFTGRRDWRRGWYPIAAAAKSLQSCPTLWDPIDGSPPGSPVPGILQARTLEWLSFPSPMHEREKWKWSRSVVSNSVRPHGLQPTRLLCPWDSPGKSTGVGCHCLLQVFYGLETKVWSWAPLTPGDPKKQESAKNSTKMVRSGPKAKQLLVLSKSSAQKFDWG